MTQWGNETSKGFSVVYAEPLTRGGTVIGMFDALDTYSHTIQAFGGFDSAKFSLNDTDCPLGDWLENGLGRYIRTYSPDQKLVWEGFVDQVSVNVGGLSITRGPLLNIGNRVDISYSAFDFGYDPPIPGIRKNSGLANDLPSQERYGILYKLLSASGVTDTNILLLRSTFLEENAVPELTQSFSLSGSNITLSVDCKGFFHYLTYPYNKVSPGFTNVGEKIKDIIGDEPNGFLSTDFTEIAPNAMTVPWWELDNQPAKDVLRGLVAMGDANATRYLFGVYEERKCKYGPVPGDVEYDVRLRDRRQYIYDRAGGLVHPHDLRPGKWIRFIDFLPGHIHSGSLRNDPRNLFIETVEFQAPFGWSVQGGKTNTLPQKLAKFGLSGMFA